MKKSMMKNKKKITKILAVVLSLVIVLLSAFYFVNDVEAKRNILRSVSDQYSGSTSFKILEIVPATDATTHINEEIGYYVKATAGNESYVEVSKAKSLKPFLTAVPADQEADWYDGLKKFRSYGMVKYSGADAKALQPANDSFVSENPIYSQLETFKKGNSTPVSYYTIVPDESSMLVKGTFTQVAANAGSYRVLPGYEFTGGVISKVDVEMVSDNTVSPPTVISQNTYTPVVVPDGADYSAIGFANIGIEYVGAAAGDLKFDNDAYGNYFGYNTQAYMYISKTPENKFYNGDWFKEYVLGDQAITTSIDITTKKATDVTAAELDTFDLVYISGKSVDFKSNTADISNDVLAKLYNRVAVDHAKLIKDATGKILSRNKGALIMDNAAYDSVGTDNISKLAQLLWQKNQTNASLDFDPSLSTNSLRAGFDADGRITNVATVLADADLWSDVQPTMLSGATGNFVAGNLYVYNHVMSLFDTPKAAVNAEDWFATGDFNSKMKDTVVSVGFEDVRTMVEINNANNPDKQVSTAVTPALAVQFILAYDGSNYGLIKSDLHILEIQPVRQFLYNTKNESLAYEACSATVKTNRTNFVKKFIGGDFATGSNVKFVSFTSMTIEQFICTNDNLLEKYDIIYIGDERGTYYKETVVDGVSIPTYTDNNLNGNIYYNIGDKIKVSSDLANPDATVDTRFSARDLTQEKLNALKTYIDSNNPIIVASELMSVKKGAVRVDKETNPTKSLSMIGGKDKGRIDNKSKLYELFEYGELKENFIGENQVPTLMTLDEFAVFLNNPKLTLNLTDRPTEYGYSTKTVGTISGIITTQEEIKTKETVNGVERYYLSYDFNFSNISLNQSAGSTYYARLFVDVNADGRFSTAEELTDCVITNSATGIEPPYIGGTIQSYALSPNVSYRLKREVPEDYAGVLPWSLKVEAADNASVFATQKGFCVVPADKTKINILQLNEDSSPTLNLQTELTAGNNSVYGAYLSNLNDFNLTITTLTETQYDALRSNWANDEEFKKTYIASFDMVVAGFADNIQYHATNATKEGAVVRDIKQYIKMGKPVLFSHDVIMFYPLRQTAKTLRMPAGQDRYGITEDSEYPSLDGKTPVLYGTPEYNKLIASGKRIAYLPNGATPSIVPEVHGYTNLIIRRYPATGTSVGNGSGDYFVDKLNSGQITTYPYTLPEKFRVANTHGQYFQLNMEQDADFDGQGDVVVWYTIGDNINNTTSLFSQNPGDGVNNYYIYNMGNVTYTGAGHSKMGGTSAQIYEAQLFVNTLVAAYQAANKESIVKFYATKNATGQELSSLALPYDANVSKDHVIDHSIELKDKSTTDYLYKFVDPNEDSTQVANGTKAFVRVTDPNLVNGVKKVGVKFYLKVESGLTTFTTPGGLVLTPKEITLSNGEKHTVVDVPITLFDSEFKTVINKEDIKSGAMYGFYLPLSYLKTKGSINLIVESATSITTKAGTEYLPKGYDTLPIAKMDLLKLD